MVTDLLLEEALLFDFEEECDEEELPPKKRKPPPIAECCSQLCAKSEEIEAEFSTRMVISRAMIMATG